MLSCNKQFILLKSVSIFFFLFIFFTTLMVNKFKVPRMLKTFLPYALKYVYFVDLQAQKCAGNNVLFKACFEDERIEKGWYTEGMGKTAEKWHGCG